MLEGRSWQSLKERFKGSILDRLDCFDLSEEQKQQLDSNFSEQLNFDKWILLPSWKSMVRLYVLGEELWGIKIRGGPKVY